MVRAPLLALALAILLTIVPGARGAALDGSFGDGGRVVLGVPGSWVYGGDVGATLSGALTVTGATPDGFVVWRLVPGGALDRGFGSDGRTYLRGFGAASNARLGPALALAADGSAVLAGVHNDQGRRFFALARLGASGRLDPAFGPGGTVKLDLSAGTGEEAADVAIAPDGSIVAVGTAGEDVEIMRLRPDGSLDPAFGTGGHVRMRAVPGTPANSAGAVAIQPDGAIVVAGSALRGGTAFDYWVLRLRPDGTLDAGFGDGGHAVFPVGPGAALDGVASHGLSLTADGRMVVTGSALTGGGGGGLAVARLLGDGRLDTGFAGTGTLSLPLGDGATRGVGVIPGVPMLIGADIEAERNTAASRRLALVALREDGTPETAFAPGGTWKLALGGDVTRVDATAVGARPDGRVALLATVRRGDDPATAVAVALVDPRGDAGSGHDTGPKPTAAPRSRIDRPRRRHVRRVRGRATSGATLTRVEVAVVRRLGSGRCAVLRDTRGHFRRRRCTARRWIAAAGTRRWSLDITRALPRGAYVAYSRAADEEGRRESRFSTARGNRRTFTVR